MIAVLILSFQGPSAALVFPLRDPSLMWFDELFNPRRVGDVVGAFSRSLPLALVVMVLTVLISVTAGFAFRRRFPRLGPDLLHGDRQPDRARAWCCRSASSSPSAISASRPPGTARRSARICPGRCPSACSSCSRCSGGSIRPTRRRPTISAPASGRRCKGVVCRSSSRASSRSRCSASRSPMTSSRGAG